MLYYRKHYYDIHVCLYYAIVRECVLVRCKILYAKVFCIMNANDSVSVLYLSMGFGLFLSCCDG